MSNRSTKTAFGGVITALSVSLILTSSVISILSYVFSGAAGILILICALETGYERGWTAFFSTSLLSLILSADKSSVILFLIFLGYYPMVKLKIEKIKSKIVRLLLKLSIFNIAIVSEFWITVKLFDVPEQSLVWFGIPVPLALLVAANFTFIMYDRCITNLLFIYVYKYRKRLRNILNLD